jgi:hypothetical protein
MRVCVFLVCVCAHVVFVRARADMYADTGVDGNTVALADQACPCSPCGVLLYSLCHSPYEAWPRVRQGSSDSILTDQGCTSGHPYRPSYRPGVYQRLLSALLQTRDAPVAPLIRPLIDQRCASRPFMNPSADQGCTSGPPVDKACTIGSLISSHTAPAVPLLALLQARDMPAAPLIILYKRLHMCESCLEASASALGVAAGPHPVFYLVL